MHTRTLKVFKNGEQAAVKTLSYNTIAVLQKNIRSYYNSVKKVAENNPTDIYYIEIESSNRTRALS